MHDVRAQYVGNFLDDALDEHLKADVEVWNIGLQGFDVLMDDFNLFHEKGLCKIVRIHRCAQETETRGEIRGGGCGGGSIFGDRINE